MEHQSELLIYQTEEGKTKIEVRLDEDTVWLTQEQMAVLFQRERTVITKHIANVFKEGELDEESNVQKMHITNSDKPVKYYNLDVIISVGYRVKSVQGTQFRIWATHIVKGFTLDDERLKQGPKIPVIFRSCFNVLEISEVVSGIFIIIINSYFYILSVQGIITMKHFYIQIRTL